LRIAAAVDSARFAWGLHGFLRQRLSLPQAEEIVRRRMPTRDANFLSVAERAIFANPASPYRQLLALAGCENGDLQNSVRNKGLEPTLRALRDAGVYITFCPLVLEAHRSTISSPKRKTLRASHD